MKIFELERIKKIIESVDVLPVIEKSFVDYSQGKVKSAPVSELIFNDPFYAQRQLEPSRRNT